ncbi:MAG: cob(I)yrinic acid a,c-diamide adenosyltransferase [Candidatus Competibacteraceae bacterium]|jgi:cob(I)alamin adenosyltransferase|nr:cob(I)yrinic acid a,c-diamide adenosyltransferase [Candidatus Competibacteraceae bacterium]
MGHRLSKIYTRTGDKGTTGLGGGERVDKDSLRIETIGQVDELNCTIGMVLAHDIRPTISDCLSEVQHKLFDLGGELSMPGYEAIQADDVTVLEQELDAFNTDLPPLKEFILPGGGPAAAACHLARAVCRRAERHTVRLARQETINAHGQAYINRLSDLLFVLCRILARDEGGQEVLWRHDRKRKKIQPTED